MRSKTDTDLVELIRQRNTDALREIYARYGRLLYSLAVKILSNRQEAEEVVQDVLIKLWNNPERFDVSKEGKLSSWLIRVCHNAAIDKQRRRKNVTYLDGDTLADIYTLGVVLKDETEILDMRIRIESALKNLPSEQRQVIEMMFFQGSSQSEIAATLDIPLGTVKSRARLGLKKLRDVLSRDNEGVHARD